MNSGRTEVSVFQESKDISEFLMRRWKEILDVAIKKKGYFAAALSGGKTPVDFYLKLSGFKNSAYWDKTHIFLVDERFLPADHPDSNYRLLFDILLSKIPIPRQNIHPVPVETDNPELSAIEYEEELKHFFQLPMDQIPVFDLVLLGIGADGHTASLFPGDRAVHDTLHLSTFAILDKQRHSRITLTLPVINRAENIFLLATGINKANIIRKVVEEKDSSLPAALVSPKNGGLTFLFDSAAASKLQNFLSYSVIVGKESYQ